MNKVELPTFVDESEEFATVALSNRQLAFNKNNKVLYIKYNNELLPISAIPDNMNIVLDKNNNLSLNDNINIKSLEVSPDNKCKVLSTTIGENCITTNKTIILLVKYSDTDTGGISGLIYRLGENVCGSYHIVIEPNGEGIIEGATTNSIKGIIVTKSLNGTKYVGIQFNSSDTSTLYFHGFDERVSLPPDFSTYTDKDLED